MTSEGNMREILPVNHNKAGLFELSFFVEGQFDPPSYFKKNQSNTNDFTQLLKGLYEVGLS